MQAKSLRDHDENLLAIALEAARGAAAVIRRAAPGRADLEWEQKGRSDFVTRVDKAAEERIASIVGDRCRGATIVGEELSPQAPIDSGTVFIVDPLDGTTNFLHGYAEFAVSIGVAVDGELRAGVVLNVARGDTFTAIKGEGARLDDSPIHVSTLADNRRALIGTGFPFKHIEMLPEYLGQFSRVVRETAGVRRAGSAALDLANVACGRFDAFWELALAPWDVAAGILLVREAGGVVTDLAGNAALPRAGAFVAGNPAMHAWLATTLAEAGATTTTETR